MTISRRVVTLTRPRMLAGVVMPSQTTKVGGADMDAVAGGEEDAVPGQMGAGKQRAGLLT